MSSLQTCLSALALAFVAGTAMAEGPSPLAEDKLRHNVEPTRAEKLEACILLWEEANHITKRRWREICREQEHAR